MDPATAAVIVLLACSQDSGTCREVRTTDSFASITECREALRPLIARLQTSQRHITGRCESTGLDTIATGSIAEGDIAPAEGAASGALLFDSHGRPTANRMVQVTRHYHDGTVTRGYVVPSEQ